MSQCQTRTCRSDHIRIIGDIYGAPYDSFLLFFNGLRHPYTDYTDFSNTPYIRNTIL